MSSKSEESYEITDCQGFMTRKVVLKRRKKISLANKLSLKGSCSNTGVFITYSGGFNLQKPPY